MPQPLLADVPAEFPVPPLFALPPVVTEPPALGAPPVLKPPTFNMPPAALDPPVANDPPIGIVLPVASAPPIADAPPVAQLPPNEGPAFDEPPLFDVAVPDAPEHPTQALKARPVAKTLLIFVAALILVIVTPTPCDVYVSSAQGIATDSWSGPMSDVLKSVVRWTTVIEMSSSLASVAIFGCGANRGRVADA